VKKREKTKKRLVDWIEFFLGENQTLCVDVGSFFGPGLNRVFVINKDEKVKIKADASSGSHFRFSKGRERPKSADFVITNISSAESMADILEGKFWNQFNWLDKITQNKNFRRKVRRRILKLVAEFEARAAQELNAIPRPSRKPSKN